MKAGQQDPALLAKKTLSDRQESQPEGTATALVLHCQSFQQCSILIYMLMVLYNPSQLLCF
jgi:hypothetical protein